jgi:hypothetical protein
MYTEALVPWSRVIVYSGKHDDETARVFYNSSYYIQCPVTERFAYWIAPDHIMRHIDTVSGNRRKTKTVMTMYDYRKGRFVGRVFIPEKELCLRWRLSQEDRIFMDVLDNKCFFIACAIRYGSNIISLTTYDWVPRQEGVEFQVNLTRLQNTTFAGKIGQHDAVSVHQLIEGIVFSSIYYDGLALELVILRNAHLGLAMEQRGLVTFSAPFKTITINRKLGCFLIGQSTTISLFLVEVGCFVRNQLRGKKHGLVRKQKIIMIEARLGYDLLNYKNQSVFIDKNMNMLQLHLHRGLDGTLMHTSVNVHRRLV